jgi:hypothetical protein
MSLLGFILLLGLTTPQNQPVAAQQNDVSPAQQFQLQDQHNLRIQVQQRSLEDVRRALQFAGSANMCFAIRSYVFDRQDGNAPVLVSTTTCTPADTLRRQQVANPPKARLVPQ